VFQGHLFVFDRLLSESSLATHPLNPMTDPDIRRWLSRQCRDPVGLVNFASVAQGPEKVREELDKAAARGERLVIVDAIRDEDLLSIGKACADSPLLAGGSGIALGLPANFISRGLVAGIRRPFAGVTGPEAILAGSCSRTTLAQIDLHRKAHPALGISVDALMSNRVKASDLVDFVRENEGRQPLVFSSDSPDRVAA